MRKLNSGYVTNDLQFEYGKDTAANLGCAAVLRGQMMYFGGTGDLMRQVSLTFNELRIYETCLWFNGGT